MKLKKPLNELTNEEAFTCLKRAAIAIIQGDDLQEEVRRWIGNGLLAMCGGDNLNTAFVVTKKKTGNPQTHARRYAMVENLRKKGLTKTAAIEKVANDNHLSSETILSSWRIQNSIQKRFREKLQGGN
jgi:hypothetical protein